MTEYFISTNNKKTGPFSLDSKEIQNINGETLIWRKGMEEWTKAKDLSELNDILGNIPPPIPIQNNNSFGEYIKKNFKYILLTFGISLVVGYYIHEDYYDYIVATKYGGYQNDYYKEHWRDFSDEIIATRDLLKFIAWSIGLFIVPIFYFFKKKT